MFLGLRSELHCIRRWRVALCCCRTCRTGRDGCWVRYQQLLLLGPPFRIRGFSWPRRWSHGWTWIWWAVPFHFVKHVLIGTSEDDGAGSRLGAALEKDEIVVSDCFFNNLITFSQVGRVEHFLTFGSGQSINNSGSGQFGNSAHISLADSSQSQASGLEHVFWCGIVNTSAGDDDIGSCFDDFVDSWFKYVAFLLPDLL